MSARDALLQIRDTAIAAIAALDGTTPITPTTPGPGPVTPQPQQPQQPYIPAGVIPMETPPIGTHPVYQFEAGKTYAMRVPRAASVMMCQCAGTQGQTLTQVEMTFSKVAGDRNYYATPDAGVATGGRQGTVYPGRAEGDPHGGGVALRWSPDGRDVSSKFTPEMTEAFINFYSVQTGEMEVWISGA